MQLKQEIRTIESDGRKMKAILLSPKSQKKTYPGILWLHGGGYLAGFSEMVHMSRGKEAAEKLGAVVLSPEYRLSTAVPYPAALRDAYAALLYLRNHAEELHIRPDQIIVGGESAGGGLTAALCMYAKDLGEVSVAFQLPLYPMLDCFDTESSKNNHGKIWNTRRNRFSWKKYLGPLYGLSDIPCYASPSRRTDYSGLPPAYTFCMDGEPFYSETVEYIDNLKKAGIKAELDVYHGDTHAFDMLFPRLAVSRKARAAFLEHVKEAFETSFAEQPGE